MPRYIGPRYSRHLESMGIDTYADLALYEGEGAENPNADYEGDDCPQCEDRAFVHPSCSMCRGTGRV